MGKFYFAFAWGIIVILHVCICKNKICIWSDPGVNLPICKYTLVCICVRMRHLLTPSKICTPEYIYTRVFLAHANWTFVFVMSLMFNDREPREHNLNVPKVGTKIRLTDVLCQNIKEDICRQNYYRVVYMY